MRLEANAVDAGQTVLHFCKLVARLRFAPAKVEETEDKEDSSVGSRLELYPFYIYSIYELLFLVKPLKNTPLGHPTANMIQAFYLEKMLTNY